MALPDALIKEIPTGGNILSIPRFKQNQSDFYDQLLNYSAQKLQNPYAGFDPIANQARTRFSQQVVPELAHQFTGATGGRIGSGAFASQLGSAGSNLETNLAALQSQYGLQNENQALAFADRGLTPQYENALQPSQYQELLGGLAAGAPKYAELLGKTAGGLFGTGTSPDKAPTSSTSVIPEVLTKAAEGAAPALGGAIGSAASKLLKPADISKVATQNPALAKSLLNKATDVAAPAAGAAAAGGIGAKLAGAASAALPVLVPALGALATVGGFTYLLYKLFDDEWI